MRHLWGVMKLEEGRYSVRRARIIDGRNKIEVYGEYSRPEDAKKAADYLNDNNLEMAALVRQICIGVKE